ncbi:MAG: hypothetical protein AAGJ08_16480 [Cyanobacteria bacterium P01_H01_bin.35]
MNLSKFTGDYLSSQKGAPFQLSVISYQLSVFPSNSVSHHKITIQKKVRHFSYQLSVISYQLSVISFSLKLSIAP